jgi:hypothetical protein
MMEVNNGRQHKGHDGRSHTKVIDKRASGFITYMPLTLAWSMNVHKLQGLTLKHETQVVFEEFFKQPAMVYVAISRVADPKKLALVGAGTLVKQFGSDVPFKMCDEPRLATLCNMASKCTGYL